MKNTTSVSSVAMSQKGQEAISRGSVVTVLNTYGGICWNIHPGKSTVLKVPCFEAVKAVAPRTK